MNRPNLNPLLEQLHTVGNTVGKGGDIVKGVALFVHFPSSFEFYEQRGLVQSVWPLYVSLEMHQCRSVPPHQRGLPSLADVTPPASVIERDANPAPLQSLAEGWGGTGRDIERDMRKEVGHGRQANTCWLWASRETQRRPGLVKQVLS